MMGVIEEPARAAGGGRGGQEREHEHKRERVKETRLGMLRGLLGVPLGQNPKH